MNKKIFYIIFIALMIVILMALLWWWFLRREANSIQTTGTFGTAQNAGQTTGGTDTGPDTNIGTQLPGQNTPDGQTTNTNIQLGNVGTGGVPVGGTQTGGVVVGPPVVLGSVGVPGVVWLSGAPPTTTTPSIIITQPGGSNATTTVVTTGGPGTVFNPTGINQIVTSNPVGNGGILPNIGTNAYGQQVNGSGGSALEGLGLAVGAGLVSCAIVPALQLVAEEVFGSKTAAKQAALQAGATAGSAATAAMSVSTVDIGVNARLAVGIPGLASSVVGSQQGEQSIDQFLGCMTRNVAKILLQQITISVVNWINSGFNGSPSFVQNPTQFLQRTADQIAGQYIQSSALSFLCSPFQLQVKVAIAMSYAGRSSAENACTLTRVSNNINNFMRGTFSRAGGWPALLSFTSVPTNNPYGAFMYGSAGIQLATANAQGQVRTDLLQSGGFLSFQQKVPSSCVTTSSPPPPSLNKSVTEIAGPNLPGQPTQYQVCDYINTTPGRIIASSLESTLKGSIDQLTLAKSFDEIISALINQLMVRTLQGGLSNLSGQNGYGSNFYTTDQMQGQNQQQSLIIQMQNDTNVATQYASVQQGSIGDIQIVQFQLNDVYNCWNRHAGTNTVAQQNADQASTTIKSLNATVDGYNEKITKANGSIITIQDFQSRVLSVTSLQQLTSVQNEYASVKASGQLPTQADVVNAQQTRTTLQNQMNTISQQASASLQQCNAIH